MPKVRQSKPTQPPKSFKRAAIKRTRDINFEAVRVQQALLDFDEDQLSDALKLAALRALSTAAGELTYIHYLIETSRIERARALNAQSANTSPHTSESISTQET